MNRMQQGNQLYDQKQLARAYEDNSTCSCVGKQMRDGLLLMFTLRHGLFIVLSLWL